MQSGFCDLAFAILRRLQAAKRRWKRDLDACCGHQLEDACPRRGRSPTGQPERCKRLQKGPEPALPRSSRSGNKVSSSCFQSASACNFTAFRSLQKRCAAACCTEAHLGRSTSCRCETLPLQHGNVCRRIDLVRQRGWRVSPPSGVLTHRKYRHSTRDACNNLPGNAQFFQSLPDASHCRTHRITVGLKTRPGNAPRMF